VAQGAAAGEDAMATAMTMVRIYLSESDRTQNHNTMKAIFERLHDQHKVHGVTVFRGIAGFGARGEVHSADLLRLTADLPLVIEFFDETEAVESALLWIKKMVPPKHIVSWPVEGNIT
jgi:PII-like signaling protein